MEGGRVAYEAYHAYFREDFVPWELLATRSQRAWCASALAVEACDAAMRAQLSAAALDQLMETGSGGGNGSG